MALTDGSEGQLIAIQTYENIATEVFPSPFFPFPSPSLLSCHHPFPPRSLFFFFNLIIIREKELIFISKKLAQFHFLLSKFSQIVCQMILYFILKIIFIDFFFSATTPYRPQTIVHIEGKKEEKNVIQITDTSFKKEDVSGMAWPGYYFVYVFCPQIISLC